jgi:hypothetical protein
MPSNTNFMNFYTQWRWLNVDINLSQAQIQMIIYAIQGKIEERKREISCLSSGYGFLKIEKENEIACLRDVLAELGKHLEEM